MATASTSIVSEPTQNVVSVPVQKKILQDVLECIIQLKTDFFESHQPITDDSVVLQRFCAKFEHLIQIGMKEKTSLLGRKKDYWDYFCECLASAKGSNDGIKYVKSLAENKTSLGRGRAFIRFCLVHQRLADTLQQCVAHDKTTDWFTPSSVFLSQRDCQNLINSLYDLNSLHFDLSPRGYDLDAAWPSFSNRKPGPGGSWNVPISRRSSVTSMDTVSQISLSVDNTDVDRLTKDLEYAQNAKSELIGRIDALQQEKEQVNQSAWATHGELQALQQQLRQLQSQHASLQERYKELDISHMKLKLEKEHAEKFLRDEITILNEKFREEQSKRVSQLKSEEEIWKKEVREEGDRKKREIDRLQKELELQMKEAEMERDRSAEQRQALQSLMAEFDVTSDSEYFRDSLLKLTQHIKALQQELSTVVSEKAHIQILLDGKEADKDQRLSSLEGQLLELEQALKESQEIQTSLNSKVALSDRELKAERDHNDSLRGKESLLESNLNEQEIKLKEIQEEIINAEKKCRELEATNNDLTKEKNELRQILEEVESRNASLKYELEKKNADLELSRSNTEEKERKFSELTQVIENNLLQLKNQEAQLQSLKEVCEKKKEEVLILKQSSEGQATDLEKLLEKKNQALTTMRAELDVVTKQLELVSKEAAEVGNGNVELTTKLSAAEVQIASLKNQCRESEEKVISLEMERNNVKQEAQSKDGVIKEAEAEINKLKDNLTLVKENLISVMSQVDKLRADQLESDSEKEGLRADVKMLQAEKESLKNEMNVEKNRIMGLLQESEGVKRSEGEKDEKIASLIVETEQLRYEKEQTVAGLEKQIKFLTADITDKNTNIFAMNSEIENLKITLKNEKLSKAEVIENKESEIQKLIVEKNESELKLKSIIAKLESEAEEIKHSKENETALYSERIKNMESQLAEKERALEAKCLDYEELNKELAELAKTSSEQVDIINKLTSEVATLTEERDHLLAQVNGALEDAQQIQFQLTEVSEQLALSTIQLETVTTEKDSLCSELTAISEELTKAQNEKDALEREINNLKNSLEASEDEAQAKLSQKREVERELEDLKDRFSKVMAENRELGVQLEGYQSQTEFSTKVLEENLVEAKDAVERLKIEAMQMKEKYESAEKERDDLKERLEKMNAERKSLSCQTDSLKVESDNLDGSELSQLKEELRKERQNYLSTVESLNEEISALQFQLSAEQMSKHDTSQTRVSTDETTQELKTRISDMEVIIEQLETELQTIEKTKHMDSAQVKNTIQQVQELQKQLHSKQDECLRLESHIQQITSKLVEETSRREKFESDNTLLRRLYDRDIEERDLEIRNLKSDNEQIKKKLVKLIKDKDTLWHKTDELVTEQKRIMGDRWQDNARITHCPQCKTEFSLFVRKHHCRVCGRIFCWSCSDFWIDSPHDSKKIRSCKPCFNHNNTLGTALQSTSMIDAESDDDDDDEAADNGDEGREEKSGTNSSISTKADVVSPTYSQTYEEKMPYGDETAPFSNPMAVLDDPDDSDEAGGPLADAPRRGSEEGISDDSLFQILDQEAVMKSISAYNHIIPASDMPPNMTSSMLLLAEDLNSGEVNRQNEVWIKPGNTFVVPVSIEQQNTMLLWEFTSQPKDIAFSVNYRANESAPFTEAEEIVAPCKCDSHKQTVQGELIAKQPGIYTLVFDNSYSKVTSKKVHYSLQYKKQI